MDDYHDFSDTPQEQKENEEYKRWFENRVKLREANDRLLYLAKFILSNSYRLAESDTNYWVVSDHTISELKKCVQAIEIFTTNSGDKS